MALGIQSDSGGLNAANNLLQTNRKMGNVLQKLSSGLRINMAKDGPADLIISELLRSQTSGLQRAMRNSQEAFNVLSIAEGGLNEMSEQLKSMRGLAIQALNDGVTSSGQISALQSQLNGSIGAIGHIAQSTRYSSDFLLNGQQDILVSKEDPSGIVDLTATRADAIGDDNAPVRMQYTADTANQAEKAYLEKDFGATELAADQAFTVTGAEGARTFEFAAGTSIEEMAEQINNSTGSTGVTAYAVDGGETLRLVSEEYGSEASVQVEQRAGDAFAAEGETVRDEGQDATLSVNGETVSTTGLTLEASTGSFEGTIAFAEGDPSATTIAQTGYDQDTLTDADADRAATLQPEGGMRFQLGETAGTQSRERVGIPPMDPANLGRTTVDGEGYALNDLLSGGSAALATNPEAALAVIDQAIADVATARARIGAYQQNTLQSNVNNLTVALENTMATESSIRDTNMATAVSEWVKTQILEQTGLMAVQSANTNRQNVLRLLGE